MKLLKCAVQTYDWGKIGADSEVFDLVSSTGDVKLDPTLPYAEMWMGTHPSGPSTVVLNDGRKIPLNDYILERPEILGSGVQRHFGNNLPFLFKVLSVNKSLSIQAHPNKEHAAQLHAAKPEIYKDPNHKPEMAIALTPFEALCGFRSIDEVVGYLNSLPELMDLIGEKTVQELSISADKTAALRECFTVLMKCPKDEVKKCLDLLLQRVDSLPDQGEGLLGSLLRRLHSEFPGDVGCLCIYFMSHVVLQPGEAVFLGANLIHAYLKGDCVECMACSDNVVRAGLTPKFKDVDTLCSMLNYEPHTPIETLFKPVKKGSVTDYAPPIPDFAVQKLDCAPGDEIVAPALPSAGIVLVVQGAGEFVDLDSNDRFSFGRGCVLFTEAHQKLAIKSTSNDPVLIFRAYSDIY